MVDFSDVMRFAETHRACGSVAPAITPQPSGGYLLTLTCACGAVLDRRVTADEATHAPFLAAVGLLAEVAEELLVHCRFDAI